MRPTLLAASAALSIILLPALAPSARAQSETDPVEVTIAAIEGLQYDSLRIAVAPGAAVRLTLVNRDDMPHNLVITEPGARETVVQAALTLGTDGPALDFVPDLPEVLYATPMLEPEGAFTLEFTAPSEPGVYPYVCTFPGHGFVMYGALYVTTDALPPLASDPNVPPRDLVDVARSGHPYPLELPAIYRTFMPDSGPASIAVGLEHDLSYCWDAGRSTLRYVWHGGFLNQQENWKGKGRGRGVILGSVFYRNETGFPFRAADGSDLPEPDFLGYRLIDGRPEFSYRIGEATVHEGFTSSTDGAHLDRTFRIENLDVPLRFVADAAWSVTDPPGDAAPSAVVGPTFDLSPGDAYEFTLTLDAPAPPTP